MVSGNPTPLRGARTILRLGTVMASQMIMSSHAGLTFMYRVGGILIHDLPEAPVYIASNELDYAPP